MANSHPTRETDFTPDRCTRCEERLQSYADGRPHFEVSALQKAMLAGKTGGVIHIAEVGAFTWREFVVLADILLSGVWKRTTVDEGAQLMKLFHHSSGPAYPYELRHDSLRFLAWILTGWPDSDGAQVAHEMLRRWLCCETEYSRFHLPSEWVGKDIEDRKIPPAVRDMMDQLCARFESTNSESSHAASNSPLHTPVHIWEPQFDS